MNRRDFIQSLAWAGLFAQTGCSTISRALDGGMGTPSREGKSMAGFHAEPIPLLRVGFIGVGHRGPGHVRSLSRLPNVEIRAIGDLYEDRVNKQIKFLTDAKKPEPKGYFGSPDAWKAICERDDIDLIYICTPWLWHTPMAVYAMQCGKHVVMEVPAAVTVEQCWELVDTSEKTRRHCMMLENCCYGENEMLALSLCRKGVLGELVHGEAAYLHDLSHSKLNEESTGGYQGQWRLEWTKQHTGNPYPTHGLGPVAQYMNINRGDRFDYLTSISSDVFRMPQLGAAKYGENSPQAKYSYYRQGDMNTTIIRTYRGRTILVEHDTTSPAPYSRINTIKGTKGILSDYPLRVALLPNPHNWMDAKQLEELKQKYGHPLWQKNGNAAKAHGGHGGMDFLLNLRLCYCLQNGLPLDMDVYDAASWSSLVELTERSVLGGGKPVDIPDFTRGGWKTAEPLGIVNV
ncbi:MAG: Gfo/Idh/MocA family oxidoreductase [Kiritimatiellae bacterium]|nr:Gfo/Idh/MocA family oxidoreductase [Kiritimatiellia bacterium]